MKDSRAESGNLLFCIEQKTALNLWQWSITLKCLDSEKATVERLTLRRLQKGFFCITGMRGVEEEMEMARKLT